MDRLGSIPSKTYVQLANYGLAVRNYRLLHCAIDDLEKGYYEVAMNLLRTVDECENLMRYFAKDENKKMKPRYDGSTKARKARKLKVKKLKAIQFYRMVKLGKGLG